MNLGCFYKLYAWNGEKIVYKRKVFGPPNYLATVYEVPLNLCHLLAVEEDRSINSSYLNLVSNEFADRLWFPMIVHKAQAVAVIYCFQSWPYVTV